MQVEISKKFKPLFLLDEAHVLMNDSSLSDDEREYFKQLSKVHTVIETGGRFSSKSYSTGVAANTWSHNHEHKVLYTRYTMASAEDSVIPEFEEKIDVLGLNKFYKATRDRVRHLTNGSEIVFKGIKTSSGNQSAKLKSLKGFSRWILDEAEEMPTFDEWDKIKLSIRHPERKNVCVMMLNPTTKMHWIYQHFYQDAGVPEGFNGIKDGVLYIHSTYLDVDRKYIPDEIWERFEKYRVSYELVESTPRDEREMLDRVIIKQWKYYKHTVLGGWLEKAEGVIYEDWIEEPFPEDLPYSFGLDYGYEPHPTALVKVAINHDQMKIHVKQCIYKTKLSADDIGKAVQHYCKPNELIVCDSADKRMNIMLRTKYNLNAQKTIKGNDSIITGIRTCQSYTICVDPESHDIKNELNNYVWNDKRAGIPVKENDDAMDAMRYNVARQVVLKS